MKESLNIICLISLLAFVSCKTQEDIRREKAVESLNEELQQTKKSTFTGNSRLNSVEEQLAKVTGLTEEMAHNKAQMIKENQALNERIVALEENQKRQSEILKTLSEKTVEQQTYIAEVLSELKKLSEKPEKSSAKKKVVKPDSVELDLEEEVADKVSSEPTLENGLLKFKAKDFDGAKEILSQVIENKKSSKRTKEAALHHLGIIEFKNKNYEAAKVHLSKLFSDNPESKYAAGTLLFLGKTFKALKSKEEAEMTFAELKERFPKSKEAQEASKLK